MGSDLKNSATQNNTTSILEDPTAKSRFYAVGEALRTVLGQTCVNQISLGGLQWLGWTPVAWVDSSSITHPNLRTKTDRTWVTPSVLPVRKTSIPQGPGQPVPPGPGLGPQQFQARPVDTPPPTTGHLHRTPLKRPREPSEPSACDLPSEVQ